LPGLASLYVISSSPAYYQSVTDQHCKADSFPPLSEGHGADQAKDLRECGQATSFGPSPPLREGGGFTLISKKRTWLIATVERRSAGSPTFEAQKSADCVRPKRRDVVFVAAEKDPGEAKLALHDQGRTWNRADGLGARQACSSRTESWASRILMTSRRLRTDAASVAQQARPPIGPAHTTPPCHILLDQSPPAAR